MEHLKSGPCPLSWRGRMSRSSLNKPRVAIIGTYQVGKSSLMNCLLSDSTASIGEGIPTTHAVSRWQYSADPKQTVKLYHDNQQKPLTMELMAYRKHDQETSPVFSNIDRIEFNLKRDSLELVDLLDTPGFDNGDKGEQDTRLTEETMMKEADYLVVIVQNKDLSQPAKNVITLAAKSEKPFSVLINCFEANPDPFNEKNIKIAKIVSEMLAQLGAMPVGVCHSSSVWCCNVAWYWVAVMSALPPDQLSATHRNRLTDLQADKDHFFNKQQLKPTVNELLERSNCLPVKEFITGRTLCLRTAPTISKLSRAAEDWRNSLLAEVEAAQRTISSSNH